MRHVNVYGTLGPACGTAEILMQMLEAGMDGIRLNLSHTSLAEAEPLLEALAQASARCGIRPELLIDMQGPELRIGALPAPLALQAGGVVAAADLLLPTKVLDCLREAPVGQEILLDDGKLSLRTVAADQLLVLRGGLLTGRKSVALPGCEIFAPAMTEADRENVRQARAFGVTAVMQPFVRSKADLCEVREELAKSGSSHIRVFAKIENREGIRRLEELIPNCDEIIIARGDLGNAMPLWKLPAAQKRIAEACRKANRDFMVVTQMLDSMIHRQVPTRAEVCDVFNAVLDGAASVMVTGETAAGAYPVETIRFLANTVREAEAFLRD